MIVLAGVALACGWSSRPTEPLRRMADPQAPAVFALLINGGGSPERNYQSHWLHVRELTEVLVSRGLPLEHIIVFASDGEDPGADLAVRAAQRDDRFWLVEDLPVGNNLRPRVKLENSVFENLSVYPATRCPTQLLRPAHPIPTHGVEVQPGLPRAPRRVRPARAGRSLRFRWPHPDLCIRP